MKPLEPQVQRQNGLRLWPDPILRQKANIVTEFTTELNTEILGMIQLMKMAGGIALAAPQAGILKRVVCWNIDGNEGFWINPELIYKSEELQTVQEGCLSFPPIMIEVTRSQVVTVKYQDMDGNFQEQICTNLMAVMAQHEIDHLNGIVFIKDLSHLKRDIITKKMAKFTKKITKIKENYEQQIRNHGTIVSPISKPADAEYDFSIPSESV